jgi:citrate lyase subunit beta/citryl-CoA lyase
MSVRDATTWLFVPGSRPDRFDRASSAGADEVIIDLEDAVAADAKAEARDQVAAWLDGQGSAWVRVNGVDTDWYDDDIAALRSRPGLRGLVVPKAEDPATLARLRDRLAPGVAVLALVESAVGIVDASAIAASGAVDRLAFGSIDFALDIGADESNDAMLLARSTLVIASRVGSLPPPVDGVTMATGDQDATRTAAAYARSLGFGGKLCIHPSQIEPVASAFRPTPDQLAWATKVLDSVPDSLPAGTDPGAFSVEGVMVDRPVLARARSIVAAAR